MSKKYNKKITEAVVKKAAKDGMTAEEFCEEYDLNITKFKSVLSALFNGADLRRITNSFNRNERKEQAQPSALDILREKEADLAQKAMDATVVLEEATKLHNSDRKALQNILDEHAKFLTELNMVRESIDSLLRVNICVSSTGELVSETELNDSGWKAIRDSLLDDDRFSSLTISQLKTLAKAAAVTKNLGDKKVDWRFEEDTTLSGFLELILSPGEPT